jgi:hypothetical protein
MTKPLNSNDNNGVSKLKYLDEYSDLVTKLRWDFPVLLKGVGLLFFFFFLNIII